VPLDLRPASAGDRSAIAALVRASELEVIGRVTADWDEITVFLWATPGFEPSLDAVVAEVDGSAVAFAGVFPHDESEDEPDGSMVVVDHRRRVVDPELEATLVEWVERRALERGATAVRQFVPRQDERRRELLATRGFAAVRATFTMHRDLPDQSDATPPDRITVTTLAEHPDLRGLHAAAQESFAEHFGFVPEPFERWRASRMPVDTYDPAQWWLALDGDEIVGYLLQVTGGVVAQVGELGVRPAWRGRGIGTALLRRSFADIARRGAREVTLWVDAENGTGAVRVYERVGMTPVVVTDTFDKELR